MEPGAVLYDIAARDRPDEADPARFSHFTLTEAGQADPGIVAAEPGWTLYCLDRERRQALFVRVPADLDLAAVPFAHAAQFAEARSALAVRFDVLDGVAAATALPESLVLVFNIGRCGSTLVSRMLDALPGTWSLSEPTAFFELAMQRASMDPAEAERLIAAVMRLSLRPPRGADVRRFAVKFHSQTLPQAGLYHRAFPGAVLLFLYRDAESWVQSGCRFEQKLGHDVAPRDWEAIRWHWWIWSAAADPELLARYVDLVHMEALIAAAWICHIDTYLAAVGCGVPFHAFSYDELNQRREASVARLLAACGCPAALAPRLLAAYAEDSQSGTAVGRDRPARGLDPEQWRRVRAVLAARPDLEAGRVRLPDAGAREAAR